MGRVALTRPPGVDAAAAGLSLAAIGACAMGAVVGFNPGHEGPVLCPMRLVTSLPCPFCGLSRSLMALGHGDLMTSLRLSPLGLIVLPLAVIILVATVLSVVSARRPQWPRCSLWAGMGLIALTWGYN